MSSRIYLDHNATTPLREELIPYLSSLMEGVYANPSSVHADGQKAKKVLDDARCNIATLLNAHEREIIFTSGGTESNNLALRGVMYAGSQKKHFIIGATEHPSVLSVARHLKGEGYSFSVLPVDSGGHYSPEKLRELIQNDTALVSLHYVNSETGVIQDIRRLGEVCRRKHVLFHVDAVQALGKIDLDFDDLPLDLLSASSHKINGPKGVGLLAVSSQTHIKPLILGGNQEGGRRAGTENIHAIATFAKALEYFLQDREFYTTITETLRNRFEDELKLRLPFIIINGDKESRLCSTSNISFPAIDGEGLLMRIDLEGVSASLGSACSSGSMKPSHVLQAMGIDNSLLLSSLRFSFGYKNKIEEVDRAVNIIATSALRLRGTAR